MRNHYTKKEIDQLIKSMVILVDTREQQNNHIVDFFNKKKINFENKKLDFGDYSVYIPKNAEFCVLRPIWFDKDIVVERKANLAELAGNIGKERERFEKELIKKKNAKMYLMVEDGSWNKIHTEDYRSEYKAKSYLASLHTFMARYDISVDFVEKERAGAFIVGILHYYLREKLLNFEPMKVE